MRRFLPLARQLAGRVPRRSEPLEDLYQVACLGLIKAIDAYDVDQGTAFSSYAVPTIAGEIKRHFRDKTWAMRVPRDVKDLSVSVEREIDRMTQSLGHPPTVPDLARALHAAAEDVVEALQAIRAREPVSLDAPTRSEEELVSLGDAVGELDEGYHRVEQRSVVDDLLRGLSVRDRQVVRLRFLHDLTQEQIGQRIGVSQMQVSRILRTATEQLRAQVR